MKYDFLVLGASGMQGRIVVRDLLERGYRVFGAARHLAGLEALRKAHRTLGIATVDLEKTKEITKLINKARPQVVVNCAEGDWDLNAYQAALAAGVHVIDLGSDIPMTKAQLALDKKFRAKGLTAITGCGSTPGVNNIALHYAASFLDEIHHVEAGFAWTSNIKKFVVPFSMASIIEEFTQPAPYVKDGKWYRATPMETIETRTFRTIGKQKCFLVRHSETDTFYEYYKDRGLKDIHYYAGFPDHSFEVIQETIAHTDWERDLVTMKDGQVVSLYDVSRLMDEMYPKPKGYTENENLWVLIEGKKDGQKKKIFMECLVPTLKGWEDAGCNIDTGLPASIIAQMIFDGTIASYGSFAPEAVVPPKQFFAALRKRNMKMYLNGKLIN